MSACGEVGALTVAGRVVGQLRCELDAGHEITRVVVSDPHTIIVDEHGVPLPIVEPIEIRGTPHEARLTWAPEAEPDLDLFDPDESFDVDVPFET